MDFGALKAQAVTFKKKRWGAKLKSVRLTESAGNANRKRMGSSILSSIRLK